MNQKESPLAVAIFYILIIGLFSLPLMFIKDIKCSKANDTCSIYNKNILLNKIELISEFHISDIDSVWLPQVHKSRNYRLILKFKTRPSLDMGIRTMTEERAFKIYTDMISKENYELRGNYWKSLWGCY